MDVMCPVKEQVGRAGPASQPQEEAHINSAGASDCQFFDVFAFKTQQLQQPILDHRKTSTFRRVSPNSQDCGLCSVRQHLSLWSEHTRFYECN